jgi:hypothetical protein
MSSHRKLRLDLQDLHVESFDPTLRAAGRGTVLGNNLTQQIDCYTFYDGCPYSATLACSACSCQYASCPETCAPPPETQEITCLGATCYWVGGAAFYDGVC